MILGKIKNAESASDNDKTNKTPIEDAKRYIDFHFMDVNLSVREIAESLDMSEVYFRKLFKERYCQSPIQYIVSVRLCKARELMQYPFLTLEECALQSGFSSQQYLSKVFKKNIGTTPAAYRKRVH